MYDKETDLLSINLDQIKQARERISPYIWKTPFLRSEYLSLTTQKDIWIKYESLQRTGSFKIRGASNCILSHLAQAKKSGVIAASAGNHAQGVAATSKLLGIPATIVMPKSTPVIKIQNTQKWGAKVELVGSVYDEAFEYATELSKKHNYLLIHPFQDPYVIAGQGTVGLELVEEPAFKEIEAVVVCVGGGGLSMGLAIALKTLRPDIKVYGVGAKNAPSTWRSFHLGKCVEEPVTFTIAEGVATKNTKPPMLALMKKYLDNFFVVEEEAIVHAISVLAEQTKVVAEGAGALGVAALLGGLIPEKKVAIMLSGANIDLATLTHVLQRGMVEQERLVRLNVTIIDRPGSLNQLTTILAELGTNVVQVFHQRVSMHSAFGEAEVEWDLETKGKDHTAEIISTLTQKGYRVKRAF